MVDSESWLLVVLSLWSIMKVKAVAAASFLLNNSVVALLHLRVAFEIMEPQFLSSHFSGIWFTFAFTFNFTFTFTSLKTYNRLSTHCFTASLLPPSPVVSNLFSIPWYSHIASKKTNQPPFSPFSSSSNSNSNSSSSSSSSSFGSGHESSNTQLRPIFYLPRVRPIEESILRLVFAQKKVSLSLVAPSDDKSPNTMLNSFYFLVEGVSIENHLFVVGLHLSLQYSLFSNWRTRVACFYFDRHAAAKELCCNLVASLLLLSLVSTWLPGKRISFTIWEEISE